MQLHILQRQQEWSDEGEFSSQILLYHVLSQLRVTKCHQLQIA